VGQVDRRGSDPRDVAKIADALRVTGFLPRPAGGGPAGAEPSEAAVDGALRSFQDREGPVPTIMIPCPIRSLFPFPRQERARRRCRGIVKRPRRPEGVGKATRRAAPRGPRTSSRAACDAPASRRAVLLAGNLGAPSYEARDHDRGY